MAPARSVGRIADGAANAESFGVTVDVGPSEAASSSYRRTRQAGLSRLMVIERYSEGI